MQEHQIIKKETYSEDIKKFVLYEPLITKHCQPGEFIITRTKEYSERIPLTIADFNRDEKTLTIIFQEVGKSTLELGKLEEGDIILDVIGPLGKPTHIKNYGTVVCIGGGIGVAPVYPIAKKLKEVGNKVISVIGARNKSLLIMEDEMKQVSDEFIITTDDGSYGKKGFVTDALRELIDSGNKLDLCVAIGPVIMMKMVVKVTKEFNIPTIVSLNPIMVDGTGMCGACRVSIGGKTKFACVDGPDFDGFEVDFNELMKRQKIYTDEEKFALEEYNKRIKKSLND
ncbi:sulfide/dihydroorotate dehydrogenase-like FAD/NAD-binding protein [Candidatus Dependentiae bacterium]|nr:sulfide/dihydroorotate dehydrogenase-like FAD/NAD-binding protein [Candidatus Dependentiae bacterium]